MSVLSTLQTRLSEAETAYHNLMIGGRALVFVDQNGERIEYDKQSSMRLAAYINALKQEIALLTGAAPTGPLSVWM